jgi:hypothetical protein
MKIIMDKRILLPMHCTLNRRHFLAVADFWQEKTLFRITPKMMLLQNYEAPIYGIDARLLPSEFYVENIYRADSWRGCPWCGALGNDYSDHLRYFWRCGMCLGLNCVGHDEACRYMCACGYIATRFLPRGPLTVRGAEAQQLAMAAMQVTAVAVWRR